MTCLGTHVTVKACSRIERIIMGIQHLSPFGVFIKSDDNRTDYINIIYNLEMLNFYTSAEIIILKSQIKCVPFVRYKDHDTSCLLFHSKRITDVINGIPTPSNWHNNGKSNCGQLKFDMRTPKQTVISSLFESGIIPPLVYDYLVHNIR